MALYQLYVNSAGVWQWVSAIDAKDHPTALRQAIGCLKPEHYQLPIRLEQEVAAEAKPKPKRGRPK